MAGGLTVWGRPLFGVCLLLSWVNSLSNALSAEAMPYTRGIDPAVLLRPGRRGWTLAAASAAFLAAAASFTAGRAQLASGAVVLVLIGWLRRVEIGQWPAQEVVRLGKYFPAAACLAAYLVAFAVSRSEAAGWEAACGVVAAAYAISAWMKWKQAGRQWFSPANMGLLLAERSHDKPAALAGVRVFLARSPKVCVFLAAAGLAVEALAVVFVAPAARWPFALVSTAFQLLIAVLLGYAELEWILVPIALAAAAGGAL